MNTQQQNKKKEEVYSISGFRDTLSSPVFYPVIVVTLVLGVTSMFGFVQNPLKLKSIVNVIQQKVATNVVSDSNKASQPYVVKNIVKNDLVVTQAVKNSEISSSALLNQSNQTNFAVELFSEIDANSTEKMPVAESFERIAFNYEVTSQRFWTDLDSSKLETASEEMERKEREASTFGAPLQIDSLENLPADYKIKDSSIYAINNIKGF